MAPCRSSLSGPEMRTVSALIEAWTRFNFASFRCRTTSFACSLVRPSWISTTCRADAAAAVSTFPGFKFFKGTLRFTIFDWSTSHTAATRLSSGAVSVMVLAFGSSSMPTFMPLKSKRCVISLVAWSTAFWTSIMSTPVVTSKLLLAAIGRLSSPVYFVAARRRPRPFSGGGPRAPPPRPLRWGAPARAPLPRSLPPAGIPGREPRHPRRDLARGPAGRAGQHLVAHRLDRPALRRPQHALPRLAERHERVLVVLVREVDGIGPRDLGREHGHDADHVAPDR